MLGEMVTVPTVWSFRGLDEYRGSEKGVEIVAQDLCIPHSLQETGLSLSKASSHGRRPRHP